MSTTGMMMTTTTTTSTVLTSSRTTTIVVGLNAALQKRLILPDPVVLVPGNVHRATMVEIGLGGKGQNVVNALLSALHYRLPLRLVQFLGTGPEGDVVWDWLVHRFGHTTLIPWTTIRTNSPLRTCTSIVTCQETTELVEPSGFIQQHEMKQLLDDLKDDQRSLLQQPQQKAPPPQTVSALCIMGSMPPGCPEDTYARIYQQVVAMNQRQWQLQQQTTTTTKQIHTLLPTLFCLIDSVIGLEELLHAIRITTSLTDTNDPKAIVDTPGMTSKTTSLLKINASEFCKLAGISKSASETNGILPHELQNAIQQFFQLYHDAKHVLDAIAITDGKHPAYVIIVRNTAVSIYQLDVIHLDYTIPTTIPTTTTTTATTITSRNGKEQPEQQQQQQHLYPIGAGDSVAAGILASWQSLTFGPCLDEMVEEVLYNTMTIVQSCLASTTATTGTTTTKTDEHQDEINHHDTNEHLTQKILATFRFGLLCGSASCLNPENAFCHHDDIVRLHQYQSRSFVKFLQTITIISPTE